MDLPLISIPSSISHLLINTILEFPPTSLAIGKLKELGCSNGVEPIFQVSYTRKSESLHHEDTYYKVFTPIIKEYMEANNISYEEDLPEVIVTTSNLALFEIANLIVYVSPAFAVIN